MRFGIAGAAASAIYAIVYLLLTLYVFPRSWAIAAVPPAFCVGVLFGFFAHSRWSFRGHDTRGAGPALRVRFVAVQACGFAINAIVTWIATVPLDLPAWVPLVPAVVLAAVATFLLNRFWVFR